IHREPDARSVQTASGGPFVKSRVLITGIGAITPIGIGRKALWEGALAGRRGVKAIDRFDVSELRSKVAGQIDDFDAVTFLDRKQAQRTERFSQFAISAARMAFDDAGIALSGDDPEMGAWIGTVL